MPRKGEILKDPETGNTYEFLQTAKSSNGVSVSVKMNLVYRGKLVPNHFHTLQDEHFEVLSGKLTIFKNGKEFVLAAGEKIELPKNEAHNHYNAHSEPVSFVQTITPALDFDYLLENRIGLTKDGKISNGKAKILQELVNLKYFESKSYLADLPLGIQKTMANSFAPLGKFLGYRAIYKKYSGMEK